MYYFFLQGTKIINHSPGNPLHSSSTGVEHFISAILSYLSFFAPAFTPYQGRDPRRKYINTYPIASKSSRRLCSKEKNIVFNCSCFICSLSTIPIPLCELIEEYLTVPMNDFPSLYSICYPVLGSLNRFARPKSIK